MLISDEIAKIIEEIIFSENGDAQIRRNELATKVGCVPSQINYVITSRFTPARGYVVDSKRGGGGYIRIRKMNVDKGTYLSNLREAAGDFLESSDMKVFLYDMYKRGIISGKQVNTLSHILSDSSLRRLPHDLACALRADLFSAALIDIENSDI